MRRKSTLSERWTDNRNECGVTRIEQGLELVRRACDDPEAVPAAQQLLRNWHHRLGRVTVLNHVALGQLLDRVEVLTELLG